MQKKTSPKIETSSDWLPVFSARDCCGLTAAVELPYCAAPAVNDASAEALGPAKGGVHGASGGGSAPSLLIATTLVMRMMGVRMNEMTPHQPKKAVMSVISFAMRRPHSRQSSAVKFLL